MSARRLAAKSDRRGRLGVCVLRALVAIVGLALCLPDAGAQDSPPPPSLFANPAGMSVAYRQGHVMSRGLVMGEQGFPMFAEYDVETGDPIRVIGEAVGKYKDAKILAASTYREWIEVNEAHVEEVEQSGGEWELVTRAEYAGLTFTFVTGDPVYQEGKPPLAPTTTSVLLHKHDAVPLNAAPIIAQYRIDLTQTPDLPAQVVSVLLDRNGRVIYRSRHRIGYRVAFIQNRDDPKFFVDPSRDLDPQLGRERDPGFAVADGRIIAPLSGVPVSMLLGAGVTLPPDGHFMIPYMNFCYGPIAFVLPDMVTAQLYFENLNPKSRSRAPRASYFVYRPHFNFCANLGTLPSFAVEQINQIAVSEVPVDMIVDASMLTGRAALCNPRFVAGDAEPSDAEFRDVCHLPDQPDPLAAVSVADETRYESLEDLDLAYELGEQRLGDDDEDFRPLGLLETISGEDLRNTDMYIYRGATGELLASRQGLTEAESAFSLLPLIGPSPYRRAVPLNESGQAGDIFFYRFMFRSGLDQIFTQRGPFHELFNLDPDPFSAWQAGAGLEPALHQRRADHLRPGELVRIIAVNRSTGYMASTRMEILGAADASDLLNYGTIGTIVEDLRLLPPNLKVHVRRHSVIADDKVQQQVGFEGSGLTSDLAIVVETEWVARDGTPLPADLPGFTGRLSTVIAPNVLGNPGQVAHFEIRPGKHLQVIQLPQASINNRHYYIHVSGEPIDRNPDFSASNLGETKLRHRPARYVPIKVYLLDERSTRDNALLDAQVIRTEWENGQRDAWTPGDDAPLLEAVERLHEWVYRPEMQFSLFDLDVHALEYETTPDRDVLEVAHDLVGQELDALERFGPDREIAFALGYAEALASHGTEQTTTIENALAQRHLLPMAQVSLVADARDYLRPEDYLALQIYQNDDPGNLLYALDDQPPLLASARRLELRRDFQRGGFDAPVTGRGDPEATDTYELISFEANRRVSVSAKLHDRNGNERETLVRPTLLPPGKRSFLVTYDDVLSAGIRPGSGLDFEVVLEATLADTLPGQPPVTHRVRYPGNLAEGYENRLLGQLYEQDVYLVDGSLNLRRDEFQYKGHGPQLSMSRLFNDQRRRGGLLGYNWSHSHDITLSAVGWGDTASDFNLPRWVVDLKRDGFFDPDEIPDTDGELRLLSVSVGGLFKKVAGTWYPQRGNHGKIIELGDEIIYRAKDGTEYVFDRPRPGLSEPAALLEKPTHMSVGDLIVTRIGFHPSGLLLGSDPPPRPERTTVEPMSWVKEVRDRNGNPLFYSYEPAGEMGDEKRLTSVSDGCQRQLEFRYETLTDPDTGEPVEVLSTVAGTGGIEVSYDYRIEGGEALLVRTRRAGRTETFDYERWTEDDGFSLTAATNSRNHTTRYRYERSAALPACIAPQAPGRRFESVVTGVHYPGPDQESYTFGYQCEPKNLRTVTDPRGNVTTYELNPFGNPIVVDEAGERTTRLTWTTDLGEPDNLLRFRSDPRDGGETFEGELTHELRYDLNGNLVEERHPDGRTVTMAWDPDLNLPRSRTNRRGHTETWTYDDKGNLESHTDVAGYEESFTYNERGELETLTNQRGFVTRFSYDQCGNTESLQTPELTQRFEHDVRGRLTRFRSGREGDWTQLDYDALDYLDQQIDPDGVVSGYDHDAEGNLLAQTDRFGLRIERAYDERNRLTGATRNAELGGAMSYDYDGNGNLTLITDWKGEPTRHTYDALDRLTSTIKGDYRYEVLAYDENNNVLSELECGLTTTFGYDETNRRVRRTHPGLGTSTLAFDDEAHSLNVTEQLTAQTSREIAYQYDPRGLPLSVTIIGDEGQRTVTRAYTPTGQVDHVVDPLGRKTAFGYDGNDRLVRVEEPMARVSTFGYDGENNVISTRITADDEMPDFVVTRTFDHFQRITREEDALGYVSLYAYDDAMGTLVKTREIVSGGTAENEGAQVRTARRDPLRRVTSYVNALGDEAFFAYDVNDNVVEFTNPRGFTTVTAYDVLDRPVAQLEAGLRLTETEHDCAGNVTKETLYVGGESSIVAGVARNDGGEARETLYAYNDLNLPARVSYPLGRVEEFDYDRAGNLRTRRVIDQSGQQAAVREESFDYDDFFQRRRSTDAEGKVVSYEYDDAGNLRLVKDELGRLSAFWYDDLNRATRAVGDVARLAVADDPFAVDESTGTILFRDRRYTALDDLERTTDARGHTTSYRYSARGDLVAACLPPGCDGSSTTTYAYDGLGNRVKRTVNRVPAVRAHVTEYAFDAESRLLFETVTDGLDVPEFRKSYGYTYDENGNRARVDLPNAVAGLLPDNAFEYRYDPLDRLSRVLNAGGAFAGGYAFDYDEADNLVSQVDSRGKKVEYRYDQLDRLTLLRQSEDGTSLDTAFRYDAFGAVREIDYPNGRKVEIDYDRLNRERVRRHTRAERPGEIRFERDYFDNGTLAKVVGPEGEHVFRYDELDRLQTVDQRGFEIRYGYDDASNVVLVESDGGSTRYGYNARDELETADWGDGAGERQVTYRRRADGRVTQVEYPNGTLTRYSYRPDDLVERIEHLHADETAFAVYAYRYDHNGNVLEESVTLDDVTETTVFAYDTADRLTSYTRTGADGVTLVEYMLDAAGNRIEEKVTVDGAVEDHYRYVYSDTDRLTGIWDLLKSELADPPDVGYAYDESGNLVERVDRTAAAPESTRFLYDQRDQLVTVARGPPGSEEVVAEYAYDFAGRRILNRHSERGDVAYQYAGGEILDERYAATGDPLAHYRHGVGLLAMTAGGDEQLYHQDRYDSTVALTDLGGNVRATYRLDPWGEIRSQRGASLNRQIFTGQEHDERTGLINFGARYYDPRAGRFTSQDPYLGSPGTPLSLNRYLYAHANPMTYVDRTGFSAEPAGGGQATADPWTAPASKDLAVSRRALAMTKLFEGANWSVMTREGSVMAMRQYALPISMESIAYDYGQAVAQGLADKYDLLIEVEKYLGIYDEEKYRRSAEAMAELMWRVAGIVDVVSGLRDLWVARYLVGVGMAAWPLSPVVAGVAITAAVVLTVFAIDDIQSGVRTAWSGEYVPSLTNQLLVDAGYGEGEAAVLEYGFSMLRGRLAMASVRLAKGARAARLAQMRALMGHRLRGASGLSNRFARRGDYHVGSRQGHVGSIYNPEPYRGTTKKENCVACVSAYLRTRRTGEFIDADGIEWEMGGQLGVTRKVDHYESLGYINQAADVRLASGEGIRGKFEDVSLNRGEYVLVQKKQNGEAHALIGKVFPNGEKLIIDPHYGPASTIVVLEDPKTGRAIDTGIGWVNIHRAN